MLGIAEKVSSKSELAYQPTIDGLRAIAVVAVLLFHFGVPGFSGGFVGVDIFFVISGFLITSIIDHEMRQGTFSFPAFYERRIRRIIPALYAVIGIFSLLGLLLLLPTDLVILAKSLLASVAFAANIFFWRSTGYFDPASETNPFLHMWSLAVEEQFYIFFPPLLLFLNARFNRFKFGVIIAAAIASFVLCTVVVVGRPTAAFYLPVFRAWELLVGSILALTPRSAKNVAMAEHASFAGFLLMFVSIVTFSKSTVFPGWSALLPVGGAALVLRYADDGNKVGRLLSLRSVVGIGLISYSLYLWHWPILAFWRIFHGSELSSAERLKLMGLSVAVAYLSYRYVERPFRRRTSNLARENVFKGWSLSTLAIVIAGVMIWSESGLPSRFPADVAMLDAERTPEIPFRPCIVDSNFSHRFQTRDFCSLGAPETVPNLLLWGDSHLLAWAPAFHEALLRRRGSSVFVAASGCAPIASQGEQKMTCRDESEAVRVYLREHEEIRTVVLVAAWSMYRSANDDSTSPATKAFDDAFMATLATLHAANRRVVILGPIPLAPGGGPFAMAMAKARAEPLPHPTSFVDYQRLNSGFIALSRMAVEKGLAEFIDAAPWFCKEGFCDYQVDGLPLYRDGGHLNVRGALSKVDELDFALGKAGVW